MHNNTNTVGSQTPANTVKRPQIKRFEEKFRLTISDDAQKKIDELCSRISNIEWSGILFFKILSGDTHDISNLHIQVVDLFLQDIGTAGYTEYEYGVDYAGYMAENLELMECEAGHVHSHHNMGTFFSGTDDEELIDSACAYPNKIFLSLIVNNAGTYSACLALLSNLETSATFVYKTPTYSGNMVETREDKSITNEVVRVFNATIDPLPLSQLSNDIQERIKQIKDAKAKLPPKHQELIKTPTLFDSQPTFSSTVPKSSEHTNIIEKTPAQLGIDYALKLLTVSLYYDGTLAEALKVIKKVPIDEYETAIQTFEEYLLFPTLEDIYLDEDILEALAAGIKYLQTSYYKENTYVKAVIAILEDTLIFKQS